VTAVAGPVAEKAGAYGIGVPVTAPPAVHRQSAEIETPLSDSDYSDQVVFLGRLKRGRVRESRRVVHVFPLALDTPRDTTLTASCGETLAVDDLQWLPQVTGMPCERCVLHTMVQR
jgi:hypothetical protein